MTFSSFLYTLLIGPLELLFEAIFTFANRLIANPGLSIVALSLSMNLLLMPLYKRADAIQDQQMQAEKKMQRWTAHIKRYFSGDERFMMLQTYYRQNHYHPWDVLKGTVSLLPEIPFFIAAYNFLSGLKMLQNVSFGPIANLAEPDGLLVIADVAINVLPIAMTLINLVSSAIYTRGMSLRSKLQLYGMAAIFLILLYDSPSGLVFYWTLNNLFSLIKNILTRLPKPRLVVSILSSLAGLSLLGLMVLKPGLGMRKLVLLLAVVILLQLPLVLYKTLGRKKAGKAVILTKQDSSLFLLGAVFLTVLTGLLIPSAVMASSPQEFIDMKLLINPASYLLNSGLLAAGTFLVWLGVFYMLAAPKAKRMMGLAVWLLAGMTVVNYMFFGTDYGTLSSQLQYDVFPDTSMKEQLLNLAVLAVLASAMVLIWKYRPRALGIIYLSGCLAIGGMFCLNLYKTYTEAQDKIGEVRQIQSQQSNVTIPMTRTGKNVVVLMMDRAINSYLPFMMQERPELSQQFAGFTYYPNTISYGGHTNFGAPALYGGYEYRPKEMNSRDQELLRDKHDEALKVMPVNFYESGYAVTVCDPSLAGYDNIPDLSIYDDYPDMNTYVLSHAFNYLELTQEGAVDQALRRNFFCYSLFKTAPLVVQPAIYGLGSYNRADVLFSNIDIEPDCVSQVPHSPDNISIAYGSGGAYPRFAAELMKMPEITEIRDDPQNTFLMMANEAPHGPQLLQEPEYIPNGYIDNTEYDKEHMDRFTCNGVTIPVETYDQMAHYHVNMGSILELGKWLDFLREQGIYDNTRIIIVSDHGYGLAQYEDWLLSDWYKDDVMFYNPILMVKDFGAREFRTDMNFMTNADVPTLAFQGLIEDPRNPFTGNPINSDRKQDPKHYIIASDDFDQEKNNGTQFMESPWLELSGQDIFEPANWKVQPNPSH